jgi:hypothetical protein
MWKSNHFIPMAIVGTAVFVSSLAPAIALEPLEIRAHDYHPVVFGGIQPEVLKGLAQSIDNLSADWLQLSCKYRSKIREILSYSATSSTSIMKIY